MLRSAIITALAIAVVGFAAPKSSQALVTPVQPAVAATGEPGAIENVRWVRRCHTESRLRWTYYGRQWVPVQICNRVWESNRYRRYDDDYGYRSYDRYGYERYNDSY